MSDPSRRYRVIDDIGAVRLANDAWTASERAHWRFTNNRVMRRNGVPSRAYRDLLDDPDRAPFSTPIMRGSVLHRYE